MDRNNAPRTAGRGPGEDDVDPYRDMNIQELPEWWQENIEEFRAHGMRPYRPARFSDGALVPVLVEELGERWGVDVMFSAPDPHTRDSWEIRVNGSVCREVDRERTGDGYSEYDIDSNEFVRLVQRAAADSDSK